MPNMDKIIEEALDGLNEDERQKAIQILLQMEDSTDGKSDLLEALYKEDYEEIPVDIDTFIEDPNYCGKSTGNGKLIYPYWREQLRELFADPEKYQEVAVTGSIGTGKSTMACYGMAYLLYRTMCLRDPVSFYKLTGGSTIVFAFFNNTLDLVNAVGYGTIQKIVMASPWFMERGTLSGTKNVEYVPNKPIRFKVGSTAGHALGMHILSAMLDEVSFKQGASVNMEQSKIMETYNGCFTADTEILTIDGYKKIGDLDGKTVKVFSEDDNNNIIISNECIVEHTRNVNEIIEIELENGSTIKCTPEHKIRLIDGTYKEAQYLTEDDDISSYSIEDMFKCLDYWKQFGVSSEHNMMRYINFICSILELGDRNLDVCEKHHIVPKSFCDNKFTIKLTPREHYIAHRILSKCFEGTHRRDMVFALSMFFTGCKNIDRNSVKITSSQYEKLRADIKEQCAEFSRGRIKIIKDNIMKSVHPNDIDEYINNGWKVGTLRDVSGENNPNYNSTIMSKDGKTRFIKNDQVNKYIADGWIIGRGGIGTTKGKIFINNGNCSKSVDECKVESYINSGWKLGRIVNWSAIGGKTCINNGTIDKFVTKDELDEFLLNGWVIGSIVDKSNYTYKYNGMVFKGREKLIQYIRTVENRPKFSSTALKKIISGGTVKGYEDLTGKITRTEV